MVDSSSYQYITFPALAVIKSKRFKTDSKGFYTFNFHCGFPGTGPAHYIRDMSDIRLGTCSWKYPSWTGLVYSSAEPANYLEEYAAKYDTVEVDQWFWSLGKTGAALPHRETAAEYAASTPENFRFTIKCPNALTLTHQHAKKGETLVANRYWLDADFFMRFLDTLGPLIPKAGLFIFQFEYLNKDKMPSKTRFTEELAAFIDRLPADLPYAFEIRNPRWLDAGWFRLLKERGAGAVLLQGYWMNDVAETLNSYGDLLGSRFCVRLHGEDREGMDERSAADWSAIIRPKDAELARIIPLVKQLTAGRGRQAFINSNNHYEGCAPLTIEKIRRLLAD